jgi:CRISPR type IV-associated protein Csf3
MKNLEITCELKSPLCGFPPPLDSLLNWVIAIKENSYASKGKDLKDIEELKLPLEKENFSEGWFYKCSNPIYNIEFEWIERVAKRLDIESIVNKVANFPKSNPSGRGAYKSYFLALKIQRIKFIKWFCVGDKNQIQNILQQINALGKKTSVGYGFIKSWKIEEIENDCSIIYNYDGQDYLMKSIPLEYFDSIKNSKLKNYRMQYGAYKPPYWHFENQNKIIAPEL